ncbi:hypothetical protein FISHEDRAFT_56741 [Fistulina hepatica ATCC 64428]|uniref:Transmembrane protein n=1 Tax=Fistulina hepatica ATCC 64428 TaxID=1128425 RepID=A0A0D7AHZ5_9AGAR|nr:hypothetical protein FISHEDRAFT_56741 [Fistulina hepatica ATCC 64428]
MVHVRPLTSPARWPSLISTRRLDPNHTIELPTDSPVPNGAAAGDVAFGTTTQIFVTPSASIVPQIKSSVDAVNTTTPQNCPLLACPELPDEMRCPNLTSQIVTLGTSLDAALVTHAATTLNSTLMAIGLLEDSPVHDGNETSTWRVDFSSLSPSAGDYLHNTVLRAAELAQRSPKGFRASVWLIAAFCAAYMIVGLFRLVKVIQDGVNALVVMTVFHLAQNITFTYTLRVSRTLLDAVIHPVLALLATCLAASALSTAVNFDEWTYECVQLSPTECNITKTCQPLTARMFFEMKAISVATADGSGGSAALAQLQTAAATESAPSPIFAPTQSPIIDISANPMDDELIVDEKTFEPVPAVTTTDETSSEDLIVAPLLDDRMQTAAVSSSLASDLILALTQNPVVVVSPNPIDDELLSIVDESILESLPAVVATDKASSEVRIVAPLLPGIVIDSGDAADARPPLPVLPISSSSPQSNIDNADHIVSDSGSGGCPIGALAYARSPPHDMILRTPLLLDRYCEADIMAQDDDGLTTRAPTMELLGGHTHRSVEGTSRQTAAVFGPPTHDHQPEKKQQAPNNNILPSDGKKSTLSPSPSSPPPPPPPPLVVEPVFGVLAEADDSIVVESSLVHSSLLDVEYRLVSVADRTRPSSRDEFREVVERLHLDVATRENRVLVPHHLAARITAQKDDLSVYPPHTRTRSGTYILCGPTHSSAMGTERQTAAVSRPSSTPTLPAVPPPPAAPQPVVAPRKRRRKPRLNKDGLIAVHSHLTGAGRQERCRPSSRTSSTSCSCVSGF